MFGFSTSKEFTNKHKALKKQQQRDRDKAKLIIDLTRGDEREAIGEEVSLAALVLFRGQKYPDGTSTSSDLLPSSIGGPSTSKTTAVPGGSMLPTAGGGGGEGRRQEEQIGKGGEAANGKAKEDEPEDKEGDKEDGANKDKRKRDEEGEGSETDQVRLQWDH